MHLTLFPASMDDLDALLRLEFDVYKDAPVTKWVFPNVTEEEWVCFRKPTMGSAIADESQSIIKAMLGGSYVGYTWYKHVSSSSTTKGIVDKPDNWPEGALKFYEHPCLRQCAETLNTEGKLISTPMTKDYVKGTHLDCDLPTEMRAHYSSASARASNKGDVLLAYKALC